ncbi:enolase C-terminal domain-like protein [Natronococcus jeotgali]|uniref:enolase C-terminal domain-like protein n=1 Tax=Natronococcus jeotgali TaxID=413812 RepID=UPI001EF9FBDD|nr:enolase C-terminal domain-like protein [Natronococcus jeotgali]
MEEIVRTRACDIVHPDLTNYGCLQGLQRLAAIAKSRYTTLRRTTPTGVSTAAGLHCYAGIEDHEVLEHMVATSSGTMRSSTTSYSRSSGYRSLLPVGCCDRP